MNVQDFFKIADEISVDYQKVKPNLEDQFGKKNLALAIKDQIDKAINGLDVSKIHESLNIDNIPDFGFDNSQKEEMITSICDTIENEGATLEDYIFARDTSINQIGEFVYGGLTSFDPMLDYDEEYEYDKKRAEERELALLSLELVQAFSSELIMDDDLGRHIDTEKDIMSSFKMELNPSDEVAHCYKIQSTLIAYTLLESKGISANMDKISESILESRMYIDRFALGEMKDDLNKSISQTLEALKDENPNIRDNLEMIEREFLSEKNNELEL